MEAKKIQAARRQDAGLFKVAQLSGSEMSGRADTREA